MRLVQPALSELMTFKIAESHLKLGFAAIWHTRPAYITSYWWFIVVKPQHASLGLYILKHHQDRYRPIDRLCTLIIGLKVGLHL